MASRDKPVSAESARRNLVVRLKRVEGQLRGVQAMIEAGQDCEDIALQMSAARKALDKAYFEMIACALTHPQFSGVKGETSEARIQRVAQAMAKYG
ncbi:MAG TPA: metal-sensitive transcriptional regulator [Burkholderiaceae bacterium]|nr:metal-sensitive transcriptional regulator [Burkholderiaceae bacterium]